MPVARVTRVAAAGPDDVAGLDRLAAAGAIDPRRIVAILGKTEGNGCVNDFSRGFATFALSGWLAARADAATARGACLVMSGGTEGGLSPHWLVLERLDGSAGQPGPALAIGTAHTGPLAPEDLGGPAQSAMVAAAVAAAMADAGIADPAQVHYVQVKCPLLTAARIAEATARGAECRTHDTLKSMGMSRGASALGVAAALGEVGWSARASCSAGIELLGHEVIVLGMAPGWSGPLTIGHAVMADPIDVEPVRALLAGLGLAAAGQLPPGLRGRLVALLAKADPGESGRIRGERHIMLDDSDIAATRHARALVGGALAGLVGHTAIFVSGGAEAQGPPGGGPVAAIVSRG